MSQFYDIIVDELLEYLNLFRINLVLLPISVDARTGARPRVRRRACDAHAHALVGNQPTCSANGCTAPKYTSKLPDIGISGIIVLLLYEYSFLRIRV